MKKSRIPKFRSEAVEAEFWDTHDTMDFLDELEDDFETVFVRPENGVVEIRGITWRMLVREAKKKRTTPDRLVVQWLKERLSKTG